MGLFGEIFGKEEVKKAEPDTFVISSPLKGEVLPLSQVKDEVFSSGALGTGIAVEPAEGKVVAPVDGEVASLFPTKHAVGMRTENDIEILIHIGIDTVELDGAYFEAHVEQGQKVKKGQLLVSFDVEKIREAGYVTQVPVILTNLGKYEDVKMTEKPNIDYGEELLTLS